MVEILRRLRRSVDVERELLQLLGDDRLVIARAIGNPRSYGRTDFEPKTAAEINHHALGVLPFRCVGLKSERLRRRLGQLHQGRGLTKRSRDSNDRTLTSGRVHHCGNRFRNFVRGRFDPDQPFVAKQADGGSLTRKRGRIRLGSCRADQELRRAKGVEQPRGECARLRLVGTVEQVKAGIRGRLLDRTANVSLACFHFECAVRKP